MSLAKHAALQAVINNLIDKHGPTNPELLQDLQDLRDQLEAAQHRGQVQDFARIALQLSSWIRFFFDHFPPSDPP